MGVNPFRAAAHKHPSALWCNGKSSSVQQQPFNKLFSSSEAGELHPAADGWKKEKQCVAAGTERDDRIVKFTVY